MKKRRLKKQIRIFVILLLMCLSSILGFYIQRKINFVNCEVNFNVKVESSEKINELSLVMVGDALIHSPIYNKGKSTNYNYDFMLKNIVADIKDYDLKYYNQETILGGKELGMSNYPQFNSPTEIGDAFVKQGFNLVSLATNHTLDRYYGHCEDGECFKAQGMNAIKNSREFWDRQEGVIASGSYISQEQRDEVVVMEKNGIRYCLLSYTISTNGLSVPSGKNYLVNVYSDSKAKADIEKYKDKVDLIMVAMHWGDEYSHYPNSSQKRIAKYLSGLGVNIIIGSHPHVVQPIDIIDDTLVIYSLGNFISSQVGIEKLVGLMASVNVIKRDYHGKTSISFSNIEGSLLYTYKKDCTVIPFTQLNNSILSGYKDVFKTYSKIVTAYNDKVTVKGV